MIVLNGKIMNGAVERYRQSIDRQRRRAEREVAAHPEAGLLLATIDRSGVPAFNVASHPPLDRPTAGVLRLPESTARSFGRDSIECLAEVLPAWHRICS
jgi:hypothetical protein